MRRLALLAGLLLAPACSKQGNASERPYQNGTPELLAHNTAKEVCSCLFVVGQTDEFCDQFIHFNPPIASYSVDKEKKTVSARSLTYTATAKWVSARAGCQLDD